MEDHNEPFIPVLPSDWRVSLEDLDKELTNEKVEEVDLYEQQNRLSQQWRQKRKEFQEKFAF